MLKGSINGEDENDYFGILKDGTELVYLGAPENKVIIIECEWFEPTINRATKIHKDYKIVEVRHNRWYERFDPFIIASSARQVYYVPYPRKMKDKAYWWIVIVNTIFCLDHFKKNGNKLKKEFFKKDKKRKKTKKEKEEQIKANMFWPNFS